MKRISLLALILTMSGCSMLEPIETDEVSQATTVVDAVEGDKSQDESNGLVDTLRGRTDPIAGDPAWAPIHPKQKPEHYAAATGSLFSADHISDLYDDSKPRGVGDIITVTLDETTSATKSANADMSKSNDSTMDPLSVGGQELQVGGKYNFSYDLSNSNTFAGDASSKQSNSISGYITVEVIEVLANGNLVIRGEKWMTLNTGDEYVRLSGTIRPDDISFDNTIASNRVSNARIQYSGTGIQQDMQEPGFLARFFNVSL
ncbi:flagellar basal body L-ring protein FlgH [Vibrio rotiferianus]|jgi:flagellar L-ring protein precursor FlgH|uniref:Flagellar L-ring protein n=1 Tax=Vibrio rotiferianus TaxID=190895 RepID=A0A510I3S3_9VIBR|nr:flagellar basal body L-ring protein FlgH [Vibrio rotiferianus]NOH69494.1 flagellar basal body L-ring protein FlgH [Vibrio rotiferianus]TMX40629.1 flagellar basal body L-ring protein FlgH [Vibrio rotiferianus]TMX49226.1 flagellar basal body L-ring protein FlgH [Vibrio rotiferianus]TMX58082.1 flagellar basal body L-ring protein FlgH [Vibrio rotiferianus]TMX67318.1 flagellar basal body L-ring protein FlgH [Vibrio rotiferianus]